LCYVNQTLMFDQILKIVSLRYLQFIKKFEAKLVLVFCYSVTPIIETNLASLKIGFTFLAPIAEQIPEFQRSEIITALAAIIAVFLYPAIYLIICPVFTVIPVNILEHR